MTNEKVKVIFRIILPIIFIAYASSFTFFTHTHIVNGVTIVHSHPYATNDKDQPAHEHTGHEIQLIHILSLFSAVGLITVTMLLGLFLKKHILLYHKNYFPTVSCPVNHIYRLRPPPTLS